MFLKSATRCQAGVRSQLQLSVPCTKKPALSGIPGLLASARCRSRRSCRRAGSPLVGARMKSWASDTDCRV